jgi:hypothetical protein
MKRCGRQHVAAVTIATVAPQVGEILWPQGTAQLRNFHGVVANAADVLSVVDQTGGMERGVVWRVGPRVTEANERAAQRTRGATLALYPLRCRPASSRTLDLTRIRRAL